MQELSVDKIKKQFEILGHLENNTIISEYIPPKIENRTISYRNDVLQDYQNRSLKAQKYFNYCQQYVAFFRSKSYQFLFTDYSIGRFVFQFDEEDKLFAYNMYWNPCPFSREFIKEIEENEMDVCEYIDNIEQKEKIELDKVILRTPIRFDYIKNYDDKRKEYHPVQHMHFQNSETRAKTQNIISIYSYFMFILENCYPEIYSDKKYEETIKLICKLDKETIPWLKVDKQNKNNGFGEKINTEVLSNY